MKYAHHQFLFESFSEFVLAIISIEKRPWVDFVYDTSIYTRYRKHHVQWRTKWCQHCPKCLWWSSWDFLGDQLPKRTPLTKDEESDGWLEPKTTWFNELSATFVWLSFAPSSVNALKLLGLFKVKNTTWIVIIDDWKHLEAIATSQGQIPSQSAKSFLRRHSLVAKKSVPTWLVPWATRQTLNLENPHTCWSRFSRSATTRFGNFWSHLSFCVSLFIPHFWLKHAKTYHESLQARNPPSFQENMRRFDVFVWGKAMQDFFCDISAARQTVVTRIAALVPKMIQDELSCLFLKWRSLHVWGTNKNTAPMTFIQA